MIARSQSTVRLRRAVSWIPLLVFIVFVAFLTAYPLWTVLIQSFQVATPGGSVESTTWSLEGYRAVFSSLDLVGPLASTLVIALSDVAIATVLAVGFAWLVTRTDLPFRGVIEFALWMGMFIPQVSQSLGWMLLLDPNYGLINKAFMALPFFKTAPFSIYSYVGIIWALLAFSTSMRFILITPAFRRLDGSAEEASRMSGYGTWSTLRRVTVPILLPTILAAAFLGLIRAVEGFETALLLGTPARIEVFATKVYSLVGKWNGPDFTQAGALSTVFLALIVLLVWLYNRSLRGRSFTTVTGKMPPQALVRLGKWKIPVLAFVALYFIVLVLLPILVTLLGTFMTLFGFFNIAKPFTLTHWQRALGEPMLLKAIGTTILFGAFAAVVGAFFYLVVSYIILRTHAPGRRVLDFFSWLPWAMPSILLGFGLLWMFLGNPIFNVLYGTIFAFGLAIIIKEAPLGIQMTKAALIQHSTELEEAGRLSGAGFWFRLRTIILPLMAPALITIGLLTFVSAARDVATVTLLSTGGMRTLSLLTVDYVFASNLGAASVSGFLLVLVIVAAAGVAAVIGRGRQLR